MIPRNPAPCKFLLVQHLARCRSSSHDLQQSGTKSPPNVRDHATIFWCFWGVLPPHLWDLPLWYSLRSCKNSHMVSSSLGIRWRDQSLDGSPLALSTTFHVAVLLHNCAGKEGKAPTQQSVHSPSLTQTGPKWGFLKWGHPKSSNIFRYWITVINELFLGWNPFWPLAFSTQIFTRTVKRDAGFHPSRNASLKVSFPTATWVLITFEPYKLTVWQVKHLWTGMKLRLDDPRDLLWQWCINSLVDHPRYSMVYLPTFRHKMISQL